MMRKLFALLACALVLSTFTVSVSAYPLTNVIHYEAQYTAAAPVIDGELDAAWELAGKWYTDSHYSEDSGQAYGYTSILWDQGNLYLLAVINDATIAQCGADSHTNGVNFWVSEQNTNYTTFESKAGDWHIFCNTSGNVGNYHEDQYIIDAADIAVQVYDGYYVVECAVPLQTEGLTMRDGKLIGYEVSVDDDQDGDNVRDYYCNLENLGSYWTEPMGLANVKLVGGQDLAEPTAASPFAFLFELPAMLWQAIVTFFMSIFGLA